MMRSPYFLTPLVDGKKIRGDLHYFGPWAKRENGKFIRLPGDGWKAALEDYKSKADDLHAGREPRQKADGDGCTIRQLVNAFLRSKQAKLDAGELARNTFADYHRVCARMIDHFGRNREVESVRPDDFERFRRALQKTMAVVALKNEINRCRIILRFASDQRLIAEPVHFGQSFDKPSAKMLRKARNEAGPRLFTAAEINTIIGKADVYTKAMTLLAINGGLGNLLPQRLFQKLARLLTLDTHKAFGFNFGLALRRNNDFDFAVDYCRFDLCA